MINRPKLDPTNINRFKEKYDPYYRGTGGGTGTHLTMIFPIPADEVIEDELIAHISSILKKWKPFNVHLTGFEKAFDRVNLLKIENDFRTVVSDREIEI